MRVFIAEDDAVARRLLQATLEQWRYNVETACSGDEAWQALERDDAPHLVILDWMMPGLDGPEVCRRLRQRRDGEHFYVLLLTAKREREDVVSGLESGADDFVSKPFNHEELRARLAVGSRIVTLQERLHQRVAELEQALAEVHQLRGLLPICSYCKRIREGDEYTQSVEAYLAEHSDAQFSHGVCPDCYVKHVEPQLRDL